MNQQQKLLSELEIINTKINDIMQALDGLYGEKALLEDALLQYRISNNIPVEVVTIEVSDSSTKETKHTISNQLQLIEMLTKDWDSVETDLGVLFCYKSIK